MSSNSLLLSPISPLPQCKIHKHPHNHPSNSNRPSLSNSPPSTSLYNSLIRTHIESHHPKQALSLFHHLLSHSPPHPDSFTFPLVLKACAHLSELSHGQQLHCMVLKSHSIPTHDIFISTSLIAMYAECGRIEDACLVFDGMPERNTVTWNSMMTGFVKCGDMESAVKCFVEMPVRNIVSWNSLLGGYVKADMYSEALLLFLELLVLGLKPDESTMVSLISAISNLGLLDLGRKAHGYVARNEFSLTGALGVALITMYSRCGCIDAACTVFLTIPAKNVGHWTSIIGGLANHGHIEDSLRVFSEMLHFGIKPNHITFVGVLNACRHAGLAEEGLKYFNLMRNFDIEPRIEHYGCLVDLLGRSGLIREAMELAYSLPEDPGIVVWGTLLTACINHGDVETAEIVGKKLIETKPNHGSTYVLLSNLYAKLGRWEDCRRMRRMMEERRVVKNTGFSWIEVDGRVHEFVAGDLFHVKAREIYGILEEMKGNLRWEGYGLDESDDPNSIGSIEGKDLYIES